jgi:biotin carboxylase
MPRVLLLIPTTSYKAADFIAAAEKLNIDLVVGSDQRQTLEDVFPDRMLTLDFLDKDASINRVIAFAKTHPLDAVVSTDEDAVTLAAMISRGLGLSHNPIESVQATQNKCHLRQHLTQAHVPTPKADLFSITDLPETIALRMTYPVVLKPIHLSASRGVIRANNPEEFQTAFYRITKILADREVVRRGKEAAQTILVESFIPGVEVALEGLLQNGVLSRLALFDKPDPLDGPFFEETLYVTPSRLPKPTQEAIQQATQQACHAIGLREGPVHAELRINAQGPFVIEVAARSIGGICSRTLQFGLGISLEEVMLQHALKMPIASLQRQNRASGVMMIPIPKAGVLIDVQGVEEAKGIAGIEGVVIMIRRKQRVVPLPEGRRYLGFIFARGERPEEVEQALRLAHQALRFEITS